MKITFYGAAEAVTGSKHLIETNGLRILLDCGLHQGDKKSVSGVPEPLPFDPQTINAVILSHAHADHSGMLPVLVKERFRGKIYCTEATADIAKYILLDSASVQEHDLKYATVNPETGNKPRVSYTEEEVKNALPYFETVPYFRRGKEWTKINENIRFKFYDAGHILGSAITYLEIKENGETKGLVYTGDIGEPGAPILRDPEMVEEKTDALICEATYGGTNHEPLTVAFEKIKEVIDFAVSRKGKIIVPAFALGRTQEIIYILHDLINRNLIAKIPIYVDSPLAMNISEIFDKYTEDFDEEAHKDFGSRHELPFIFKNLHYVRSAEESKELNNKLGPFMVISSSGMLEGGRILHHLKNVIENENDTVLITGFQAENTLGRKLQDGEKIVRIYGEDFKVHARIITISELSAHAGQKFLAEYIKNLQDLKDVFLVHGELSQAEALKKVLEINGQNLAVMIPKLLQSAEV